MGDRLAVMRAGAIQQLGTPQEVYATPANLFVAGFIGSPAMNLFDATLRHGSAGPQLVIGTDTEVRALALPEFRTLAGRACHHGGPRGRRRYPPRRTAPGRRKRAE